MFSNYPNFFSKLMNIDLYYQIIISWFDQLPWVDEPFNLGYEVINQLHRSRDDVTMSP